MSRHRIRMESPTIGVASIGAHTLLREYLAPCLVRMSAASVEWMQLSLSLICDNLRVRTSCHRDAKLVFWDFDGVIKDSIDVKTSLCPVVPNLEKFRPSATLMAVSRRVQLFESSTGFEACRRMEGASPLRKLPLYMAWAGLPVTETGIASCAGNSRHSPSSRYRCAVGAGVERILRENRMLGNSSSSRQPQDEMKGNPGGHRSAPVLFGGFRCADKRAAIDCLSRGRCHFFGA